MIKKHLTGFYTAMLILTLFLYSLSYSTQGFFLSNFIEKYDLKASAQGIAMISQSAFSVIAIISMMIVTGRMQKHIIVLFTLILSCVAMFGLSFAPTFSLMIIFYGMFGISLGSMDTAGNALMIDIHPKSPVRLNDMHSLFGFGNIIAPLIYQFLISIGIPWNRVFLFIFIAQALLASVFIIVVRSGNPPVENTKDTDKIKFTLKDIPLYLKSNGSILLFTSLFFYAMHQIGVVLWIRRYFEVEMGSGQMGALALSAFWLGTAVSRALLPR